MRFDNQLGLILMEDERPGGHVMYIPWRDVNNVLTYMKAGKPHWHAPTCSFVSRSMAAYILAAATTGEIAPAR